ncbi:MAG TPA: hypothetical protein VFO14_18455 [Vicinamibacterales bacterium]|nr:hypothetical protein [Vicinamibacterales bacterium]
MAAQKPAASASGTPVFFRNRYEVPAGKRLLIEDVSVMCGAVAALPFLAGNVTSGDFEKYGISGMAKFGIHYAPADCPEALDGENSAPGCSMSSEPCRSTAPTPSRLRAKGGQVAGIGAGRRFATFAEQGGILSGFCYGPTGDFPSAELTGTGRLVDR